jgi:hypothetical protein
MLQNELNLSENKPKKKQNKPTVEKQIKTILHSLDQESLQKFIIEQCKQDKKFRNYFLRKSLIIPSLQMHYPPTKICPTY